MASPKIGLDPAEIEALRKKIRKTMHDWGKQLRENPSGQPQLSAYVDIFKSRIPEKLAEIEGLRNQTPTPEALAFFCLFYADLAGSPRASLAELAAVVKRDPVLTSRVLQLANSANFATIKAQVNTVEEAVRNIGLSAVRNVAASSAIFNSFSTGSAEGLV